MVLAHATRRSLLSGGDVCRGLQCSPIPLIAEMREELRAIYSVGPYLLVLSISHDALEDSGPTSAGYFPVAAACLSASVVRSFTRSWVASSSSSSILSRSEKYIRRVQ